MRNKKTESEFIILHKNSEVLVKSSYSFNQGGFDFRIFTGLTSRGYGFIENDMRRLCKIVQRTGFCGKRRLFEPFKIKTEDGRFIMYSIAIIPCNNVNLLSESLEKETKKDYIITHQLI